MASGSAAKRLNGCLGTRAAGYRSRVAITETREVVIAATPDEIMDVLVDLESLMEWSSAHQQVEVLERDAKGRPSRSRQVVRVVGVDDEQVLDYVVHDDGVRWTLVSSKQQRAQEGHYKLTPDGDSTRVCFKLTVDPVVPLPGFLIKRAAKGLMETATDCTPARIGHRWRIISISPDNVPSSSRCPIAPLCSSANCQARV
jgi:hypothetical protein